MKKLFSMIALTVMGAYSLSGAEMAGTWKGSMETQMGDTAVTLTFQPGETLAGRASLGEFEAAIEKAGLEGDKIHFEINITHGKVSFQGTVSGDEMKLKVAGTQGDQYSLLCKRQK